MKLFYSILLTYPLLLNANPINVEGQFSDPELNQLKNEAATLRYLNQANEQKVEIFSEIGDLVSEGTDAQIEVIEKRNIYNSLIETQNKLRKCKDLKKKRCAELVKTLKELQSSYNSSGLTQDQINTKVSAPARPQVMAPVNPTVNKTYVLTKTPTESFMNETFFVSPKLFVLSLKGNSELEANTGLGLDIDGTISENALFGLELGYNSFRYYSPNPIEFKPKSKFWKVGANLKYLFKKGALRPYVGTGVYFNRFKSSIERRVVENNTFLSPYNSFNAPSERIESVSNSTTWISGRILAGSDYELGKSSGLRLSAFYERPFSSNNALATSATRFEEDLLNKINSSIENSSLYGISIGLVFKI